MTEAFETLRSGLAVSVACQALGVPRAAIYRASDRRRGWPMRAAPCRPPPPLALSPGERARLLAVLNSERFADMAPTTVYATLLDEGHYLASVRAMYRVLADAGESSERRRQRVHPAYETPESLPTRATQVWWWDVTKLKGAVRWSVYHLYVIIDIFSRYVVGWMVAPREAAELDEQLIAETTAKQQARWAISPLKERMFHAARDMSLGAVHFAHDGKKYINRVRNLNLNDRIGLIGQKPRQSTNKNVDIRERSFQVEAKNLCCSL